MDEQVESPRYATLFYAVKEALGISWHEYLLLDMVYHLSVKTGYCYKSRRAIASDLDIAHTSVSRMITRLVDKGLLDLYKSTYRVTDTYINAQSVSGAKRTNWHKTHSGGAKRTGSGAKRTQEQGYRITIEKHKEIEQLKLKNKDDYNEARAKLFGVDRWV